MALTRITKGVIKPNENYDTHNINSTGIITAIGFKGPFTGSSDIQSGILTATGIDLNGDLDVDGHTNLDNVSIAGVVTATTINATTFSGAISGTTGTFSGNVSIGGTLTYEDVTNVDSIGLITARSGIRIGAPGANTLISGTGSGIGIVTARNGIDITGGNLNAASNLILKVDGTEKSRIDSSGRLLLGVTDTTNAHGSFDDLVVKASGGGNAGITIVTGTSNQATIAFSDGTSGTAQYNGYIQYSNTGDYLSLGAGADDRIRIGSVGQIGLGGANYGTSGQVMTSQGGSAAPQWADVSAGLWSTLASGTVTSGTTGTITDNGISSTYHMYKIVFYAVMNGQGQLGIDITTDGGTSWTGGGWTYCYSGREHNQTKLNDHSSQNAGFISPDNRDQFWGEITFGGTQSTTHPSFNFVGGQHQDSSIWGGTITTNMTFPQDTAFNGIRWYSQTAAMSNVKWVLLGSTLS